LRLSNMREPRSGQLSQTAYSLKVNATDKYGQ